MRPILFRQFHNGTFYYWGVMDKKTFTAPRLALSVPSEQMTGLTDSQGLDMWEGDICELTVNLGYGLLKDLGVVVWDGKRGCFHIQAKRNLPTIPENGGGTLQEVRIVGNVHQHKELLADKKIENEQRTK